MKILTSSLTNKANLVQENELASAMMPPKSSTTNFLRTYAILLATNLTCFLLSAPAQEGADKIVPDDPSNKPTAGQVDSAKQKQVSMKMHTKITLDVDPSFGEVTHYGQDHTSSSATPRLNEVFGLCQFAILKQLYIDRLEHIFVEGRSKDVLASDPRKTKRLDPKGLISKAFPGGNIPEKPTREQLRLLADVNAETVYALFNLKVSLYAASDVELNEAASVAFDEFAPGDPEFEEKVMALREQFAMQKMIAFLKANPEIKKIGIVYGKAHDLDLKDVPAKENAPRVVAYSWPDLSYMIRTSDLKELKAARAEGDAKQLEIIERLILVHPEDFSVILTEEGQLKALPKIDLLYKIPSYSPNRKELRSILLAAALSDRVRTEIEKMYKAKTGPFEFDIDSK